MAAAEEAVRTDSRFALAFLYLGVGLFKMFELDRAEAALKKAFELAPAVGQVRLALANVYVKRGRYDMALEQLNRYLAENPGGKERPAAEEMRGKLLRAAEGEQK